jgi:cysteine desulfurase
MKIGVGLLVKFIYLDYHSTTPCDQRVVEVMQPYYYLNYSNPSSFLHLEGRKALNAVENARTKVADLIGAGSVEIIFTSGATESNNLAILGIGRSYQGVRKKILTTPIEHKSVLEPCRELQRQGYELVNLPVDHMGTVKLEEAVKLIDDTTLLVSVQAANNEIGTLQPIGEIAKIARERGALVHCDAAQAVGKIPLDVQKWGVDFLSISSHKLYGPKGVGALYMRDGPEGFPIMPVFLGGNQEHGLRPGTYNVPGVVGFGVACEICQSEMFEESKRISSLRDRLEAKLMVRIGNIQINGNMQLRLPGNSSLSFPQVEGDALLLNLPTLGLSMGSACNTGAIEPSYVLTSIGLSRDMASSTIRVGIGRFTTEREIEESADLIAAAYKQIIETGEL